jgi:hypothetical protein
MRAIVQFIAEDAHDNLNVLDNLFSAHESGKNAVHVELIAQGDKQIVRKACFTLG